MNPKPQIKRSTTHLRKSAVPAKPHQFDYSLDYKNLNLREHPELYRVGVGEQGVLMVEPYKSEILPHWKFAQPDIASKSASDIWAKFLEYKDADDFVGMDMSRKFLQMGYTRSRRYANHKSGTKYAVDGTVLPFINDPIKAASAEIFYEVWQRAEADSIYADLKLHWKFAFG